MKEKRSAGLLFIVGYANSGKSASRLANSELKKNGNQTAILIELLLGL
jgi:hypothetical protein